MPSARHASLIFLIALALRLAAGYYLHTHLAKDHRFEFGDSESYWALGHSLADGEPYEYRGAKVFRAPAYPVLLAGMFRLVGSDAGPLWARGLNAMLGAAAALAVTWWAGSLFDRRTAWLAGWLTALYPGLIAISGCVLSESLFCLLMVLQLACWTKALRNINAAASLSDSNRSSLVIRHSALWCGAAGIAAGAAALTRPSWLLFTPLALAALVALDSRSRRQTLIGGLIMLSALALTMSPWWVRNWQVRGHFLPTTLQVGASLYDGLNPDADGSSNMAFVPTFEAVERSAEKYMPEAPSDSFEYRLDRRLRGAAWDWAKTHQGRAVQLAFIKLARMWNVWPNETAFRAWPVRLVVLFTYVPIVVAAVYGAIRVRATTATYALCWLPAVYLSLVHMIFIGSLRYREPPMLGLIVLAATACATLLAAARLTSGPPHTA